MSPEQYYKELKEQLKEFNADVCSVEYLWDSFVINMKFGDLFLIMTFPTSKEFSDLNIAFYSIIEDDEVLVSNANPLITIREGMKFLTESNDSKLDGNHG